MNPRSIVLAVPGSLYQRTGGYIYDRHIVEGLLRYGWNVDVLTLDASFPNPTTAALEDAANALAGIPDGSVLIVDSLALGAMPDAIAHHAARLRVVALVHLPLSAGVDLDRDAVTRVEQNEGRALRAAALVIVTGDAALPLIARYNLPTERVIVIEPGVDPAPLARGSREPVVSLLSVATIGPGKGHEWLLDALSALSHLEWRLACAGSLTRSPQTVDRVRAAIATYRLTDRVSLLGDLDRPELAACYDDADVFVLASTRETYGMAVAEALAHGLPVVATRTGAIPQLVGNTAGLLVAVGDTQALADALSRVIADADLRARMAAGARCVRERLQPWEHTVERMAGALHALVTHG